MRKMKRTKKAWPFLAQRKKSKLKNSRVVCDGYKFASKLEAAVYFQLKVRFLAGEIEILKHQVRVKLSEAAIVYVPDFLCRDLKTNEIFYVEAKGFSTPDWKIKRKLWSFYGPAPLQIWKGTHSRPFVEETVLPQTSSKYSVKNNLFTQIAAPNGGESLVRETREHNFVPSNPTDKRGSNE
jgi:hypothetical protein